MKKKIGDEILYHNIIPRKYYSKFELFVSFAGRRRVTQRKTVMKQPVRPPPSHQIPAANHDGALPRAYVTVYYRRTTTNVIYYYHTSLSSAAAVLPGSCSGRVAATATTAVRGSSTGKRDRRRRRSDAQRSGMCTSYARREPARTVFDDKKNKIIFYR